MEIKERSIEVQKYSEKHGNDFTLYQKFQGEKKSITVIVYTSTRSRLREGGTNAELISIPLKLPMQSLKKDGLYHTYYRFEYKKVWSKL